MQLPNNTSSAKNAPHWQEEKHRLPLGGRTATRHSSDEEASHRQFGAIGPWTCCCVQGRVPPCCICPYVVFFLTSGVCVLLQMAPSGSVARVFGTNITPGARCARGAGLPVN